jgi:hypothetical protein
MVTVKKQGGDLTAAFCTPRSKQVDYRFQAQLPTIARSWLSAVRWLARGCPKEMQPRSVFIPPPQWHDMELAKIKRDITLVDLPFSRVGWVQSANEASTMVSCGRHWHLP